MAELKAKIGLDTSAFQTGLARLQNSVGAFAKGLAGAFAAGFTIDAFVSSIGKAVDKADQLQDLSDKFGISASQLQLLGNVAELSGASLETVAAALNKAAINASKAGSDSKLAENFARIGLSVQQLRTASPQDILMAFASAAEKGTLGADEFRIAQELLGRSATDLLATLRQGPAAIEAQGRAMGVWADSTTKSLSNYKDAITAIGNAITIAFGKLASFASPGLAKIAKFFGQDDIAAMLEEKSKPVQPKDQSDVTRQPFKNSAQEEINKNLRTQLEIQNKIVESKMTEDQIASRLVATYQTLSAEKQQLEKIGTPQAMVRSSEIGVEMAQIQQRLSGMGQSRGGFQVLADSLQKVGGGGRFEQIGGGQAVDYLKSIKETSAISAQSLKQIAGNGIGSVTPETVK